MESLSTIAQGLRLIGVTGATNDIVSNWLKGLGRSGTTPDMLFAYLRSTGLKGSLSDMLSAYIFGQINLIDLDSTAGAHYLLGTPFVALADFSLPVYFVTSSSTTQIIFGDSLSADSFIAILSTGVIRTKIAGVSIDSTAVFNDGEEHYLVPSREGSAVTVYVDGVLAASGTASGTVTLDSAGRNINNAPFDGVLSRPHFIDNTTSANSQYYKLNQLTANSETSDTYTLTYQNIALGAPTRDTYTLVDAGTKYLGSELFTQDLWENPQNTPDAIWSFANNKWSMIGDGGFNSLQLLYSSNNPKFSRLEGVVEALSGTGTGLTAYSTGTDNTKILSTGAYSIDAGLAVDGNQQFKRLSGTVNTTLSKPSFKSRINIAAQAPPLTALFNSSGVLTCSGTLSCSEIIPCGG
jgi:hypothetical protein